MCPYVRFFCIYKLNPVDLHSPNPIVYFYAACHYDGGDMKYKSSNTVCSIYMVLLNWILQVSEMGKFELGHMSCLRRLKDPQGASLAINM